MNQTLQRPAADLPGKIFLATITGLIVARPLVANADPGHLLLVSGGGGLTLNLLTLITLLLWSVWRLQSRQGLRSPGVLLVPLLGIVALQTISTLTVATYEHPGWFWVWESASLVALFFLVRQLSLLPGATGGLVNALLASAASVGSLAIYQQLSGPLDWPSAQIAGPDANNLLVGTPNAALDQVNLPPPAVGTAYASFDRAETLLAFCLLLFPAILYVGHVGWRQKTPRGRGRILLVLAIGLAFVCAVPSLNPTQSPNRGKQIAAGVQLAADHLAFGVGPGNFSRHADPVSAGPSSSFLGLAAAAGILAPLLFLAALGILIGKMRAAPEGEIRDQPAWRTSLYAGGVIGQLLGFALSTGDIPPEAPANAILKLGFIAGARSLVWFAALALLENVVWQRRSLIRVLGLGAFMTACFGLVSDSALLPGVQVPMWILMALVVNLGDEHHEAMAAQATRIPVLASLAGLALVALVINIIQVAKPGLATVSAVRQAREASRLLPDAVRDLSLAKGAKQTLAIQKFQSFLRGNILDPLRRGQHADPGNSALAIELSRWLRTDWEYSLKLGDTKRAADLTREMLALAEGAVKRDPRAPGPLYESIETMLFVFDESRTLRKERAVLIERSLDLVHERFPRLEPPLQFRYLSVLLRVYERPVAKQADDDRKQLRDLIEPQAIRYLKAAEAAREAGNPLPIQTGESLQRLIDRITIDIIEPVAELKELLGRKEE